MQNVHNYKMCEKRQNLTFLILIKYLLRESSKPICWQFIITILGQFYAKIDAMASKSTPAIQRSEYISCICPDPNFEFAEPYFGVATGNNCVESTSILHRTTESERGLMVGGIYNYLTIQRTNILLSLIS